MFSLFKSEEVEDNYFKEFEEFSYHILEMTELLTVSVKEEKFLTLEKEVNEVRRIEGVATEKKQAMMQQLYEDFLPPIEREDIIAITSALNHLLENIGDLIFRIDSYQIKSSSKDLLVFLKLVEEASHKSAKLIKELKQFKKAKKIFPLIQEVRAVKKRGNQFYYAALKNLYKNQEDSLNSIRYSNLYDAFDKTMDAFGELTNAVEIMIIGNS